MGTAEPSGSVAVAGPAVRLTVWPKAATAANGRIQTTRSEAFKIAFILFVRIFLSSLSIGLVDHEFPRINQHHHQHSAGENIVGGDLALVVRVPHKRKASLAGGRVGDRARRRRRAGGTACAHGRIWPKIGTAAVPRSVRQDVRIGQSGRSKACDIAERSPLKWLVVVLTPLEIVDCSGGIGVVTVGIRTTGKLGERARRSGTVTVRVTVETP